jgi:hypothetical protein
MLSSGRAVGGGLELMVITCEAEERVAMELEMSSTWLKKRVDEKISNGHTLRRRGDNRSFGERVNRERILSLCVDGQEVIV